MAETRRVSSSFARAPGSEVRTGASAVIVAKSAPSFVTRRATVRVPGPGQLYTAGRAAQAICPRLIFRSGACNIACNQALKRRHAFGVELGSAVGLEFRQGLVGRPSGSIWAAEREHI